MRAFIVIIVLDLNYSYLLFFGWLDRLYKRRRIISITTEYVNTDIFSDHQLYLAVPLATITIPIYSSFISKTQFSEKKKKKEKENNKRIATFIHLQMKNAIFEQYIENMMVKRDVRRECEPICHLTYNVVCN